MVRAPGGSGADALRLFIRPGEPSWADAVVEPRDHAHRGSFPAGGNESAREPAADRRLLGAVHARRARTPWRKTGSAPRASRPGAAAVAPAQSGDDAARVRLPAQGDPPRAGNRTRAASTP